MASDKEKMKIVSSRHLADQEGWELSEVEYGLTVVYNAFQKWIVRCVTAAGYKDFNAIDVLILHNINHRNRAKRLNDISFLLNIEDTHNVNYSIKKLVKLGLVSGEKQGKEIFYSTTEEGVELCEEYAKVRNECLLEGLMPFDRNPDELLHVAAVLRSLSGLYDQASRAATTL